MLSPWTRTYSPEREDIDDVAGILLGSLMRLTPSLFYKLLMPLIVTLDTNYCPRAG